MASYSFNSFYDTKFTVVSRIVCRIFLFSATLFLKMVELVRYRNFQLLKNSDLKIPFYR